MRDLYSRLRPLGRILNLKAEGWTVWDCAPIRGDDGLVHVFATRWPDNDRPDGTWFEFSQVVHAVSDQPQGPYTVRDIAINADGSEDAWDATGVINPKIYRAFDRYVLVYTGCHSKRHENQTIGMRVAESLDGPWRRVTDGPLIAPSPDRAGFDGYLCNNPAFVAHPNGQAWIYYKGRPVKATHEGRPVGGPMAIGLAVADALEGPYRKHEGGAVVTLPESVEDPYVWHDDEGFHMIVSRLGHEDPAGWLLRSDDGLNWSAPEPAYPSPRTFVGRDQRLEEPNLLFDAAGRATHLFNVMGTCPQDAVYSGFVFEIADERQA